MMRREGSSITHKRVQRVWQQEELPLRMKFSN